MSGAGPGLPGRALVGFCAGLLHLPDADAAELAVAVDHFSAQLPAATRRALAAGLVAVDAAAVSLGGRRLGALAPDRRDQVLARLDRSPLGDLVEAVKVPVLLVHGARLAGPELAARNAGPAVRPDAALHVVEAAQWPDRRRTDVVVVGSGAGGALVARTVARAGLGTFVVEEGRRWPVEELRQRPALERFAGLYRDAGGTVALGRPPVVLPVGRGVGGTTLVNSGTCYRTPTRVLRRWQADHGLHLADPASFGAHLDAVEELVQVGPVPDAVMGANGRVALRGAAALGWSAHPLRRNAPGCGGCCQCAIGCPRNAKFGVHLNALPDACAAGAVIVSDARVERVLHGAGRASGIRARRPDGSVFEILADHVVVAAGATETPPLLRRSGLGRHPEVGRNLALHPALSAAGWFDEAVDPTTGVLQSAGVDELHRSQRILIEATSTPPGMGSMVLPGTGRLLAAQLERSRHLATLGAMVGDAPAGAVHGRQRPVLTYRLTAGDARRLLQAVVAMGQVLLAAGARQVLTGIPGRPTVSSVAELEQAAASADIRRMHLAAFHPTGTARMGGDPQTHPVDPRGRLRGVAGVTVADASVLPSCPEVNPQLTIMALARAVAEELVGALGG